MEWKNDSVRDGWKDHGETKKVQCILLLTSWSSPSPYAVPEVALNLGILAESWKKHRFPFIVNALFGYGYFIKEILI